MIYNLTETKKITNFLLKHDIISIENKDVFNLDILLDIKNVLNFSKNSILLSKDQEKFIIDTYLKNVEPFDSNTPNLITSNQECILQVMKKDYYSINYITGRFTEEVNQIIIDTVKKDVSLVNHIHFNLPDDLKHQLIDIILNSSYYINFLSPQFLTSNYQVALKSIKEDPFTADYLTWKAFTKEEYDNLIKEIVNSNYVLNNQSCQELRENLDIVKASIEKDVQSIDYASEDIVSNPEINKRLIELGFKIDKNELKYYPLELFKDQNVMKYTLNIFGINKENELLKDDNNNSTELEEYIDRYNQLYVDILNTPPTISSFKNIFNFCAEEEWHTYRRFHLNDYTNIFNVLCSELKRDLPFETILRQNNHLLYEMKNALKEKYPLLLNAMQEYYSIKKNNQDSESYDNIRDDIAKYSALYVAISKEEYKKDAIEDYNDSIKKLFIPRIEHPLVIKKIIEQKQKSAFQSDYIVKNEDIISFIKEIEDKYSKLINKKSIKNLINNFIQNDFQDLYTESIKPFRLGNYQRYLKAKKLINRLNSNYIKYDDKEVKDYQNIISYDEVKKEYYYSGKGFSETKIKEYNNYLNKEFIFKKIKKDIIMKVKSIKIDEEINDIELNNIASSLPFTDEYFVFAGLDKLEYKLGDLTFFNIINPTSIIDDEAYNNLRNFIINNSLIWLMLIKDKRLQQVRDARTDNILKMFDHMKKITKLSKTLKYNLDNYEDIIKLYKLSICADEQTIAILGTDIIYQLTKNRGYTRSSEKKIIKIAKDLICEMAKRKMSTVPYIKGKTENYRYSIYDPLDETILLAGINTDACFRVDGNDNDFLHYCALDKNGIVLKITDTFGNFIARASGFRSGNTIFFNQLRTIYDFGGNKVFGEYNKEKEEIIETFFEACNAIREVSQTNENEEHKIENVIINRSYILSVVEANIEYDSKELIGDFPILQDTDDWKHFVENTKNLQEIDEIDDIFSIDYGAYDLISCCDVINEEGKYLIDLNDVEAVYSRDRNSIIWYDEINEEAINRINKIEAMYTYYQKKTYKPVKIPNDAIAIVGDNWYTIYNKKKIINRYLEFDEDAKKECLSTNICIKNNLMDLIKKYNNAYLVNKQKIKSFKEKYKINR